MTGDDVEPSFDDPSLDPIRALLRDARAREPVPADVVARLDAALAELRGQDQDAPVTGARVLSMPRRKSWPRLLVAAASVILLGASGGGLALALANRDSRGPASADSSSAAQASTARGPLAPSPAQSPAQGPQALSPNNLSGQVRSPGNQPDTSFTTAGFAREAAAFTPTTTPFAAGGGSGASGSGTAGGTGTANSPDQVASPAPGAPAPLAATKAAPVCVPPKLAAVDVVPITLDGQPATLILHPTSAGKQLVEAWSCDGTHVLAHATVTR
jgi:hypothetical protein